MVSFVAGAAIDAPEFFVSGLLGEVFHFGKVVDGTDTVFVLNYPDEAKTIR
jgi:hypothetical protein